MQSISNGVLFELQRTFQRPKSMGLLDGTVDHAAEQLKAVVTPLLTDAENRLQKIVEDTLDRIDGAVITFDITIRLPKKESPA